MKTNMHLKKKNNRINKMILLIILIIIFVIVMLENVSKKLSPVLFDMAEIEIKNISTVIINRSVTSALEKEIEMDKLFTITTDKNDNIQAIDFNSVIINKILATSTSTIQKQLKYLEEGNIDGLNLQDKEISIEKKNELRKGIICKIPMGVMFKNTVLSNIGPKIPIKLHYIGNINSNIKTKVMSYGINNALLEVNIELVMNARMVTPLISKNTKLEYTIPVVMKVIQGGIPNYYSGGILKDSSIYSLPF